MGSRRGLVWAMEECEPAQLRWHGWSLSVKKRQEWLLWWSEGLKTAVPASRATTVMLRHNTCRSHRGRHHYITHMIARRLRS